MGASVFTFGTAIVLLGLTGLAQPAAAAPADPYRITGCQPFSAELEYCYESKGVVQENESRSGNPQVHVTEQTCYTLTAIATGEVVDEGCYKKNFVLHQPITDRQVFHSNEKHEFTFTNSVTGTTHECTSRSNATYAHGRYRHSDIEFVCNPPF
jgi:hypothetical protein